MSRLTVALLFGGKSSEHEISVISARAVAAAIDTSRYRVLPCYIARDGRWFLDGLAREVLELDLAALMRSSSQPEAARHLHSMVLAAGQEPFGFDFAEAGIDLAFLLLHGTYGEDGRVQGLLEILGVPYTGCGTAASALTMDKALAKLAVHDAGIAVAPSITLTRTDWQDDRASFIAEASQRLAFPLFVKPANLGSSVGISKVRTPEGLQEAIELACSLDTKVLIEQAVTGREIEVAVIGNDRPEASPCGEIEPGGDFYDFDDKYMGDSARLFIPARLPEPLQAEVRAAALKAYRALGCSGMSRVDFFVDETKGTVVFNEVNTIPGFTDISMYPRLMQAAGISFTDLTDRLIRLALERAPRRAAGAVQP